MHDPLYSKDHGQIVYGYRNRVVLRAENLSEKSHHKEVLATCPSLHNDFVL